MGPRRRWKKAMLEHHTSQKKLEVFHRRPKEQEELHRSQKNPLVLHMSSKERTVRHMSLRLMVHHMNLKAGNQVRMLVLVVLHRSLKKKEMVLRGNCLQKLVLHMSC